MGTVDLLYQIQNDMSTMGSNPCLTCHCYDICQEVNGETLCGALRAYYR